MKLKLKNIIALMLMGIMLLVFTGCNYIYRPNGAKNNSADNNNRIAGILVKDQRIENTTTKTEKETIKTPNSGNQTENPPTNNNPQTPGGNGNQNTEPKEEAPESPFNAPGDAITKINAILGAIANESTEATSATGVKDELMTSRTVNVYMPYKLFDGQDTAIEKIASNLNMNVRANIITDDYVATVKRTVLAGEKADLMYVDQEAWGYTQHFTQELSSFVNFDIADKLDTFSSYLSDKFLIESSSGENKIYVASGIGAPYMLVYNPSNIVVPNITIAGDEEAGLKEVNVRDPITMYNEGTWGISAFTEILKASTTNGRVGLASIIDDDDNLDMWLGMENNASLTIDFESLIASVDTSIISRECLDTVGYNMDTIQSWYWSVLGADKSNYVGSWTNSSDWDITIEKTLGTYSGTDPISSYSFFTAEAKDFTSIKKVADRKGVKLDFVALPYGSSTEEIYRTTDTEETGVAYDNNGYPIQQYAAGWVGGFSVLKTCENPAVALRVGEEITKAWKENYEQPILAGMTEEQQARYETMMENLGISFYRSVVANSETAFKIYGTNISDRLIAENRPVYASLQMFSDSPGILTQPMYRKNETHGIYEATSFDKWSEFYYGKIDPVDGKSVLSNNLLPTISAAYLPPSMLFIY